MTLAEQAPDRIVGAGVPVSLYAAHHDGSRLYVPDSEPAPGSVTSVFARVPLVAGVDRVAVRYISDGEPRYAAAVVDRATAADVWWRADIPVRNPVTRYRFLLTGPGGYRWLTALGTAGHDVPDAHDFRLVGYDPPPAWAAEAVVYEVFPDRFARSAAADAAERGALPDWAIGCDWDTPVIGRGPQTPYQLYGGDLDGVAERLDHIAAVGANTVYLTPFFPARSNHRYDARAFDHVDPLLGGDAALYRLAEAVHRRGMRLIGDVTTNHCGDAHPWFVAALTDPDAAEREMFYFDAAGGYESWWGYRTLPKFNWASPRLRELFFDAPDAVLRRWMPPLDGWRVDVANMTGRRGADEYTLAVAAAARRAAVAARPDALLIGEHAHDFSGDLDADGWHGAMNYAGFTRPVWSWLAGPWQGPDFLGVPGPQPRLGGASVVATMRSFDSVVSWRSRVHSWSILGSHDTPRVRTVLGSAAMVAVAAGLQMTLPGVPMLYAGDEWGLRGVNGEDGRAPMPWHRPDRCDLVTFTTMQELIALRRRLPALRHGGLRWAYADDETVVFLRETVEQSLLVMARRGSGEPVRLYGLPRPDGAAGVTGDNVYGGAGALRGDADGAVTLPGDGPTFQVWALA